MMMIIRITKNWFCCDNKIYNLLICKVIELNVVIQKFTDGRLDLVGS